MYWKNRDDLRALVLRQYPSFVYRSSREIEQGEIPVFAFHSVLPDRFESQMAYLAVNGYRTLDADGLLDILRGRRPPRKNTVVLTFDDGRGSLWSTAYPILKKYGLQAIAFIVPCRIREMDDTNPTLNDVQAGRSESVLVHRRDSTEPFLTWNEIRAMHQSGVIDFQSHTSWHHSVYVSRHMVEFANPALKGSFLTGSLDPVVRRGGRDVVPECVDWGSPIYEWGPSVGSERRYLEDEDLTRILTDHVQENGGTVFFNRPGWRKSLRRLASKFESQHKTVGRFQTAEERYADIYEDLLQSKRLIEENIGKRVSHLCYPWFQGCEMAVRASRVAGYESNHWGVVGGRAVNRVGSDPYYVARMIDDYVFLLPGKGRRSLRQVMAERLRGIAGRRLGTRDI
jgi:peptidoglycan/xylan/chitin deacetylase (PgdA/CDA1 family)